LIKSRLTKSIIITDVKANENVEGEQIKSSHEYLATAGAPDSQYFLGVLYLNGNDGYEMDAEKAAYWFSLAAEKGNIDAQYQLGLLYLNGEGVEEDLQKGKFLLEQAAESGNVEAQYSLAVMYIVTDMGSNKTRSTPYFGCKWPRVKAMR